MKKLLVPMGLCALLCYTSCKSNEEKEEATTYLVTTPIIKDTVITKDYVAQIRSIRNIELRAQERGYLENIYVDEGKYVKKGQLLFRVMPRVYQAEAQKSAAEVNAAEIEVQNTQALSDKNIVSPTELALAKAKLGKAKAELALANTHLSFTDIRAPFDGIVDRLHLKLGSLVDEGDFLTSLSDNSQMWVYFNVAEAEYLTLKSHHDSAGNVKVKLRMANNEIFPYEGKVETIEGEFNNETGNIAFRATFPNPNALLRNGETGTILMDVPIKNAVIIPQKATFEILDKKYVYVVDKNHVAHLTLITVAAEMPDLYVIAGGLKGDEQIILEGIRKVKDKDKIQFKTEDPYKVMQTLQVPSE
ncbi:MAG: efflux RND transporter periplasmic adaptor subunit [Edaphocola sp.]